MRGTVLVVDDDPDLRECLKLALEVLCERNGLCLAGYRELIDRGPQVLACELAILDVNLGPGQPSGLDVLSWLREHNFGGRICFVTGHATSHPLVARAALCGDVMMLQKPITGERLRALVVEGR